MKIFLVNVNRCLNLSQYAPFFYEHMQNGQLTLLDEIADTCELDKTYRQILSEINQRPFSFREAAVILLIPRDLSRPLTPQSCELYNDINVYMHLDIPLRNNFRFYTLYVDKTGELESNDATYRRLKQIYDQVGTDDAALSSHFADWLADLPSNGDYRDHLQQRIAGLHPCTRAFFEHMLQDMPAFPDDSAAQIRNAVNHYISQCKGRLSGIRHATAPIVRNDISEDIRARLRVVYYIKSLTDAAVTLANAADFSNEDPDYEHIRRLLATYRQRLNNWYFAPCPIDRIGTYRTRNFHMNSHANSDFAQEVDKIINDHLEGINIHTAGKIDLVNEVFEQLDEIIQDARTKLELFTGNQAKELYNPNNYTQPVSHSFPLDEPPTEDELEEKRQLEKTNQHQLNNLPTFADENRLEQDLSRKNQEIIQIHNRLKVYSIASFAFMMFLAVSAVMLPYLGAQITVFIKENTWWVFGAYGGLVTLCFSVAYRVIKNKYIRQINSLLQDCLTLVSNYLADFKTLAGEFEANLKAAANYRCLKMRLDEKAAAREAYAATMTRYSWHKMRVDEILKNLSFFDHFIGDASAYPESITLDSYDHDVAHTKFYQLKQF